MSSGCGLKNSGCPSSSGGLGTEQGNAPAQPGANENDQTTSRRFIFVDGKTGSWTTLEQYQEIVCPVGSIVVFHYPASWHDVVALPSQEAYDTCDFDASDVTILSPTLLPNSTYPDVSYYHPCTEPGTIEYLTCSVPGHCLGGQKIKIRTSETDFAFDPDTEEWILHVLSIPRLLRLLDYHKGSDGLFIMDHGYQTEALAEQTLELIWCALDHCPGPALEFNPDSTIAECESMIYTLMGFVSRKRPIPQWDRAEEYYNNAISRGGSNLCAAHSYLTQLYWSRGPAYIEQAQNQTIVLCEACVESNPLLVLQARQEFKRQGFGTWPEPECAIADTSLSPSSAASLLAIGPRTPWMMLSLFLSLKFLLG